MRAMVLSNGRPGNMYLTTSYVLFDAMIGGGADSDFQIAVTLREIQSVKRMKHKLYESIEISTRDNQFLFSSVKKRQKMYEEIVRQSNYVGNTKLQHSTVAQ